VSGVPQPEESEEPEICSLCGTVVSDATERCPECGYHLAGVGSRRGPFSRAALAWSLMGFVVVYLVTLGIVALTN
jgi:predicted amidophosphoribosyltransferase